MTKRKATRIVAPPALVDKGRTMQVIVGSGESHDRAVAGMVARGLVTNASTVIRFESHEHEGLSLMEMARELRAQGEDVNRGDLASLERTLTAQVFSLNAIFGELARIAHCNIYKIPNVAERYLRLALKAQGQSRATVETLAAMKNPPVVFARQANINNGGQQQVNNAAVAATENGTHRTVAPPHAGNSFQPNELLAEDSTYGSTQLDARATTGAGRQNPRLESVGVFDRT